MYHLTITADGKTLQPRPPLSAPRALRSWHDEECTGYAVTCRDEDGAPVTKVQLRRAARAA